MEVLVFIVKLYNTFKGAFRWVGKQIQKIISSKLIKENEELKAALNKKNNMQFDEAEYFL